MSHHRNRKLDKPIPAISSPYPYRSAALLVAAAIVAAVAIYTAVNSPQSPEESPKTPVTASPDTRSTYRPSEQWLQRAYAIDELFHYVYTPCWEGANGAIGDAYLFATTNDSSLMRFHLVDHDLRKMCVGTWVDDRAWVALAELYWWKFTGKTNVALINDAQHRYHEARAEGRLSRHEGYWTWYNWPPQSAVNERIFTNSNMNQMVTVACGLYEATGDKQFRDDALLVWNGDGKTPGVEKTLYKGNGRWEGNGGLAAFGKELPWDGAEYCTIGAAMFRMTGDPKYKSIVVATAKHIMDPSHGWVDPVDYFQIHMDGNGNFVHYLMDAYETAPEELADIPDKVEKMLEHVWSNHHGMAKVTLHRLVDNGIRNGWNPFGGEDGYGVDEVGTVHAQSQAVRAFGVFAFFKNHPR